MATLTLTGLLTESLNALQILEAGGAANLSTQQLDDALIVANQLIDSKSQDPYMANSASVNPFALSSGTQSYNIGSGQTWNLVRPSDIVAAELKLANGYSAPVKIVNAVEWASIDDRDRSSYLVQNLFYDRGSPTIGLVRLSPIPLGGTMEIISWAAMTAFADKTTPITISPGYSRWLVLAFALEIAPSYGGAQITPTLLQDYADATATLRNLNAGLFGNPPPMGQVAANTTPPGMIQAPGSEAA